MSCLQRHRRALSGLAPEIMSHGVVLFTASTRSHREIEDLAAEARRLRPDVEIVIRPSVAPAYRYE